MSCKNLRKSQEKERRENMFRKLRGKIKEVYDTQKNFADALGVHETVLNQRLNGVSQWKTAEIAKACELLDIPLTEAHVYFF